MNWYAYASGDPVNHADPSGLCDEEDPTCFSVTGTGYTDPETGGGGGDLQLYAEYGIDRSGGSSPQGWGSPCAPPKGQAVPLGNLGWAQIDLLNRSNGGKGIDWNTLTPAQKVMFEVITAVAMQDKIDFSNFTINSIQVKDENRSGGPSELYLDWVHNSEKAIQSFVDSLANNPLFKSAPLPHAGYDLGNFRETRATDSLQVGIGEKGVFMDIDPHNPSYGDAVSLGGHLADMGAHALTGSDTNYWKVAQHRGLPPCMP
jgi:hypothetical protein